MYPIGTVLTIKGNENLLMIVALLVTNDKTNIIYEYAACKYPIGVVGEKEYVLFNKENIENIIHKGLESKNHDEYEQIAKAINHYGEYSELEYDISTYSEFLKLQVEKKNQVKLKRRKESTLQNEKYVEL